MANFWSGSEQAPALRCQGEPCLVCQALRTPWALQDTHRPGFGLALKPPAHPFSAGLSRLGLKHEAGAEPGLCPSGLCESGQVKGRLRSRCWAELGKLNLTSSSTPEAKMGQRY